MYDTVTVILVIYCYMVNLFCISVKYNSNS